MAEQHDEKAKLPLAGIFALISMISSFFIYQQMSLQTSRPIHKDTASHIFAEKGTVQSRLWQDPFEAVEAHRLSEKQNPEMSSHKARLPYPLSGLIKVIAESGISSGLRVVPVFVDGSPYSSSAESRLNDRYAVVSALGAAGYVPESGEYIRFFEWTRQDMTTGTTGLAVPAEFFIPKLKMQNEQNRPHVLVLWLKDQDFSQQPLRSLNELLTEFNKALKTGAPHVTSAYSALGPRFSTGLSAMLKEMDRESRDESSPSGHRCSASNPHFSELKDMRFYSPWATAKDIFLLDFSTGSENKEESRRTTEEIFDCAGIKNFTRTIDTDAVLAEQLLQELKRRRVDLKPCPGKDCNPKVALISEWDTLYGRALPRTFAAVAMNNGSGEAGPQLEAEIDKLLRDDWPEWISRHSYLAGLDGELPAKGYDKGDDKANAQAQDQAKGQAWFGNQPQGVEKNVGQRPEGRSQLDYVVRLTTSLKQEEAKNGKFSAIGVLGGDVYDKLLILQALRDRFPTAIFFTTDLNARLAFPAQWKSTRNLIIASHFGLELQPELQTPIPPFRDSYQTSLFYSALMALEYVVPVADKANCPDCVQLSADMNKKPEPKNSLKNTGPRLYEIGRHGAFDISTTHPHLPNYASIHPVRPDMDTYFDTRQNLEWLAVAVAMAVIFIMGIMLISSAAADIFLRLGSNILFWLGLAVVVVVIFDLVEGMPPAAENEPLALTEGISAWPTAAIRLLALVTSLLFLWYSRHKMKGNENILTREFAFEEKKSKVTDKSGDELRGAQSLPRILTQAVRRSLGIHMWRPHAAGQIDAIRLWREYTILGELKNFSMRGLPQVTVALCVAWLIMVLFGFPKTPCRGSSCFAINDTLIVMSVTAMMLLIFYVVDATRLCRRWVNCIAMNKVRWPDDTLAKIAGERGIGKENLDEWLGIELIAERTTVIGNFIYFPFIVMFLLGIARYNYLDNWDFPLALVIIFTLNATLIFVNSMALRKSAEIAKREAIKRLESKLIQLPGQTPDEIKQRQQIEWAIRAIKNNRRGAFLPFTQHPFFGAAIALPSGGFGLALLLEYLATGF